jgi:hypothetical protein
LHDTLNDVGIVYLSHAPYIIAVLTTELPTLDAGRQFIRGVSRLAYDELEKFANWRATNALPTLLAPASAASAATGSSSTDPSPDEKMWEPPAPLASQAPVPDRIIPLPPADVDPSPTPSATPN